MYIHTYRMKWLQICPASSRVSQCSTERYSNTHPPTSSFSSSFSSSSLAQMDCWSTSQKHSGWTNGCTLLSAWPHPSHSPPLRCSGAHCYHYPHQEQTGHHATTVQNGGKAWRLTGELCVMRAGQFIFYTLPCFFSSPVSFLPIYSKHTYPPWHKMHYQKHAGYWVDPSMV